MAKLYSNKEIPDFFIIGAPKSGTTTLSYYLQQHPDICFSNPKEPHFFDDDIAIRQNIQSFEDYCRLFEGAERFQRVGEGSTLYLFSERAIPNILQHNEKAQFIVLIRHPIDMFLSLFYHRQFNFAETGLTPEEAWRREQTMLEQELKNRTALVLYHDVCRVGEQLERLFSHVSDRHVHPVFFEDLASDSRRAYHDAVQFLNIPQYSSIDFSVRNEGKARRNPRLAYALRRIASQTKKLKRTIGFKGNSGFLSPLMRIERRDRARLTKAPISQDFRRELLDYFEDDMRKVESISGRTLSHWRT